MDLPKDKEQTARRQPWPDIARCGCQKWFIRDSFRYLQISSEKVNLVSSEVSTVHESEEDIDTADSNPENVDVEVAEYDHELT